MNLERLKYLDLNGGNLTELEINQGWHFCPDWDYALIHPYDFEYDYCNCGENRIYHTRINKINEKPN